MRPQVAEDIVGELSFVGRGDDFATGRAGEGQLDLAQQPEGEGER